MRFDGVAPEHRRLIGTVLLLVAALGAVAGVMAALVSWRDVPTWQRAADEGGVVTLQALDSVAASVDVTESIVDSTATAMQQLVSSLRTVRSMMSDARQALLATDDVTNSAADSIEAVSDLLPSVVAAARNVDRALALLDDLPFVNTSTATELGPSLEGVDVALRDLPQELRTASARIGTISDDLDLLVDDLDDQIGNLDAVVAQVSTAPQLIDDFRDSLQQARELSAATAADADRSLGLVRLVGLLGGLSFAGLQLLPYLIGRALLRQAPDQPTDASADMARRPDGEAAHSATPSPSARPLTVNESGRNNGDTAR